jgi:hypothetical protein
MLPGDLVDLLFFLHQSTRWENAKHRVCRNNLRCFTDLAAIWSLVSLRLLRAKILLRVGSDVRGVRRQENTRIPTRNIAVRARY